MSGELIPADVLGGEIVPYDFDSVSSGSASFLPRLQLFGSKSNACTKGKIPIGHWGLITEKDTIVDLGEEVDVVLIKWRPKALLIDGDNIINVYNPENDLYQDIKSKCDVKDSGCMAGPEFLVWIPTIETFASFYMASKTARRESRRVKMDKMCGKPITLKAKIIEKGKYIWHGPVVLPCSLTLDIPDMELIKGEINKFENPPEPETPELADNAPDDREH